MPESVDPFDAIVAGFGAPQRNPDLALIVTPFASAAAVATLTGAADLDCTVISSRNGAVAAMEITPDPFAELTGSVPEEALALAKAISIITKVEVVLIVVRFSATAAGDVTLEGKVNIWQVNGAELGEKLSPGLVLGGLDPVIEDLVIGERRLEDFPREHG